MFDLIDSELPVELRSDYLRIKDGVYVPKPRRQQIYDEISKIINGEDNEEG